MPWDNRSIQFPACNTAVRSHREVARIMTERGEPMTPSLVSYYEARAIFKLRAILGAAFNECLSDLARDGKTGCYPPVPLRGE
jgi:hypothetical protein